MTEEQIVDEVAQGIAREVLRQGPPSGTLVTWTRILTTDGGEIVLDELARAAIAAYSRAVSGQPTMVKR